MVSITEGADADALIRLASRIESGADQNEAVYGRVRPSLHSSGWQGVDADQFVGEWNGPQRQRLQHVASALRSAATELRRNAQDQIEASNSDGSGSPHAGTWIGGGAFGPFDPRMPIQIPGVGSFFPPIFPLGPGIFGPILRLPGLSDVRRWLSFPTYPGLSPSIFPLLGHGGILGRAWTSRMEGFGSFMTGSASTTLGLGGLSAGASGLAFAGWSAAAKGGFDAGSVHGTGEASAMAGAQATGGLSATFGRQGLDASADGHLFAGAQAETSGAISTGPISLGAQGSAMAGATADGSASLHAGSEGITAGAGGNAFAGVSAGGSVAGDISGGTVTASGRVEAGVGIGGEATVSTGWHNTEFKLGGNAALGIGLKGSVDIYVDPSQIASDTAHAAEGAYRGAENLLSDVPRPSWPF